MSTTRELSGIISKNNRKEQPTHADYRGDCLIDGVLYWINGWRKEGSTGPFLSLAFKRKDGDAAAERRAPQRVADDSDIDF